MTLHLHHLTGCAPTPLAHYLKALGILRIVAEQKDAEARGFWRDQHFCLLTKLDRSELERFFLADYEPTPFVSPWNKGSGFYAASDPALGPLEKSTATRFSPFRAGIAAARQPLAAITHADSRVRELKERTKGKKGMSAAERAGAAALKSDPDFKTQLAAAERDFKHLKANLYAPFAGEWRGGHRDWMEAAMVLNDEGLPTWPSLLGTGGNDGRLDFTNNAMQRLGELFDLASSEGTATPNADPLLKNALWGSATVEMRSASVGQHLPGQAGGANGSTGPDSSSQVNPWDFVLMLEGAVLFRGKTTRRLDSRSERRAAIPFAVHAHAVGHGTPGRESTERGEQWMPLWDKATTLGDLGALLGEGRAQLGRSTAHRPLDFARAIAKLGIARGLTGFERYAYLERNGQSKIAVPLGRIGTGERSQAQLVDDIGPWLDRLQKLVRDGGAPTRLQVVEAALADAVFGVLTHSGDPLGWQAVLLGASSVEQLQSTGTGFQAGPIPPLSTKWIDAAADDSPEWRLAVALGSAAGGYESVRPEDPIRPHTLPLAKDLRTFATADKRLLKDVRVVMLGRDALADLITLVERRLVEASQRGQRMLALCAAPGAGARADDLAAFLDGRVDVGRVVRLARALMAVQWRSTSMPRQNPIVGQSPALDEAWQALRLCGLPYKVADRRVPVDLAMIRRLASGDAAGAVTIAIRRLSAAGFRPPLTTSTADIITARRWAAALAFPIEPSVARTMAKRFQTKAMTETL